MYANYVCELLKVFRVEDGFLYMLKINLSLYPLPKNGTEFLFSTFFLVKSKGMGPSNPCP